MRVLLLQGGNPAEREISFLSAKNIAEALRKLGHTIVFYDPADGFEGILPLLPNVDVAWPALHGKSGEDGTIQAYLEEMHVPYIGAGPTASKNCFDKVLTKQILEQNGLPTPRWALVNAVEFAVHPLAKKPYVLKPRDGGSSIDTFIVRELANHPPNYKIFERYESMLLEELVTGTELSVSILGNEALPVTEIIPPAGQEFDYRNKYNGQSQEPCPPLHIPKDIQEQAQSLAEQAHFYLGGRHLSRVDMMMSKNGELSILELNTLPGMARASIYPKAAAAQGLPMTELAAKLLAMAIKESRA